MNEKRSGKNGGPAAAPQRHHQPQSGRKTALYLSQMAFLRSGQHLVLIAEQATVSHSNPTA